MPRHQHPDGVHKPQGDSSARRTDATAVAKGVDGASRAARRRSIGDVDGDALARVMPADADQEQHQLS